MGGARRARIAAVGLVLTAVAATAAGHVLAQSGGSQRASAAATKRVRFTINCRIAVPTGEASCRGRWSASGGIRDAGRVSLDSTDRGEGSSLSGVLLGHRGRINVRSDNLGWSHAHRGCPASTRWFVSGGTRSYRALGGSSDSSCTKVRVAHSSITRKDVFVVRLGGIPVPPPLRLPPPVLGRSANAATVRGTVRIKKGRRFVSIRRGRQVPVGSTLDTRRGTVRLSTATGGGKVQSGDFDGGVFKVKQTSKGREKGLTEADLNGSTRGCASRRASASRARRGRVIRRLRGHVKGRFRTRGRYSSATVRGTTYSVEDRCDGTLTTVKRGTVVVRDFKRRRNVTVRQGKHYLARP